MIKQHIPRSEKTRAWKVDNLREHAAIPDIKNEDVIRLLERASGKMKETDYTYVTKPHDLVGEQFKHYPAKLHNFDIISPIFFRIKGEYDKRPFEPIVYTKNSQFKNERLKKEKDLINQSLQQRFVNALVESQQVESAEQVEELSPEVIDREILSLKDIETIESQGVFDYIVDKQNLVKKYSDEFYMFAATNLVVSYKHVENDEVVCKKLNPAYFTHNGGPELEYFEDAPVVKATWFLTYNDIVAVFQDALEEEYPGSLAELENTWNMKPMGSWWDMFNENFYRKKTQRDETARLIQVDHIQWTSYCDQYIVGYDEWNNPIIVDEDYDGDYIKKIIGEEVREGHVINGRYYLGGDVLDEPIRKSPFKVSKNYTGRRFMNSLVQQVELPNKLYQLQESYNILKYKLQYTINKNKDKLVVMPIGLFAGAFNKDTNTDNGNELENGDQVRRKNLNNPIAEGLYFADTTQMLFVDESSEEAVIAAQMIKQIDLGLGNYIEFLLNQLRYIKAEAEEVVQFNRFITEGAKPSDSVRNTQQGVEQGSLIVELYVTEFSYYMENDMQGIIELSKYAYQSGRSLTYIRDNTTAEQLTLSRTYANILKGIFIKNSRKTQEILQMLKQESTQMLQNGMQHSTYAKMIAGTHNYASIIKDIEESEIRMQKQAEAQQQAERDNALQIQQMISKDKQAELDLKKYDIDTKADIEIQKILDAMEADSQGNDGTLESINKLRGEYLKHANDLNMKNREIASNERIANKKAETEVYKADKAVQVAKVNK